MAEVETKTSTFNIDLIVEDGRGVPNANSYVSTEYADAFAKNRNYDTWLTQSNYVKRAAVIKAMDYVDNIFNYVDDTPHGLHLGTTNPGRTIYGTLTIRFSQGKKLRFTNNKSNFKTNDNETD